MIFHVSRTLDNLLDINLHFDNEWGMVGGVSEDRLDDVVFGLADKQPITQILVPYHKWLELGQPEDLTRKITCH